MGMGGIKMSKVAFEKLRESHQLLELLILKCLSRNRKNGKILWERLDKKELDSQNMDVRFSIDGLEFPVIEIFQEFSDQHERMINEAAKDLIHEKFNNFDDVLYEMEESIKEIAFKKLGINLDLEDDY